ncbi:MAG TPA: FAD:protein FMN transferase [Ramlibacter sp.]|uniref:FAD:protein FMN transferase n=1 Tax=Ramlibacter sp. TaxID=1917967 RepID=UPI002D7F4576|nr:FAD:protein FMN transferase [Ramlibacter sp.]HET8747955.1 FAD:protein FMN transferase [Ramlibacter sp.]
MKHPQSAARRRVLLAGAGLALAPLVLAATPGEQGVRASRALMGTQVDIAARGTDAALLRAASDAAFERMAALVAVMSHYSATSEVAAIGLASGLQPVAVAPELLQVLHMAQGVSRQSGGAFDATIGSLGRWQFDPQDPRMPAPEAIRARLGAVDWRQLVLDDQAGTAYLKRRGMRLDLGGIAKLYILQAGLETLRAHGVRTALVNGGGDVVAMSERGARPWRVGIRDPRVPQRLLATLDVREGFVASSGDYERFFVRGGRRWHHVLDPRTGEPTQGPHGVTLVGRELQAVNGLGAAAMVLGAREGRALVERTRGVEGLIAGADGELWASASLRARLS